MNPGSIINRHQRLLFYACWLLLNLIQSKVTGLFDDESYYWVYSRFLDWGYFDHPPMIALLIKGGYGIIPNELGVRLFIAILSTFTLWLIQKLLIITDDVLFYTIAISIAVLQLGGFIAVPDIPLLFFTTLFFHAYKRFLNKESIRNIMLLGISAACLLYSKYTGALVLVFTFVANPKLFLKPVLYIAAGIALLLFLPHIYWQYTHAFPSVQYHLKERIDSSYQFSFTTDYLFQQLLLVGPISSIVLLWSGFRKKPADEVERALKFTTVGFYVFFLLYTFRGPVEANWTFPAFIGVIVLSHQYLAQRRHLRKLVNVLALITLFIVFAGRVYLAGVLPHIDLKDDEFLSNSEWSKEVSANSKGLPVFFVGSYQRASKFWFYTGIPTYSVNTVDYRRNGYNFWPMEDSLQNKKMLAVYQGPHTDVFKDSFNTSKGEFRAKIIEHYFSFSRILFMNEKKLEGASHLPMEFEVKCEADSNSLIRIHPQLDTACIWMAVYIKDVDEPMILRTSLTMKNITANNQILKGNVRLDIPSGQYTARFGITSCLPNWPTINSSVIDLRVK